MEYYRIGLIVRPHGVRGAVKLQPLTFDVSRFAYLKEAFIERGGKYEPITVAGGSASDSDVTLHIDGVATRDDAEKLRGLYICVDKAHAAKLPEGMYFVADLIGCRVFDDSGAELGVLDDVLETGGAGDVYSVAGQRRLMFPALKKVLVSVDTEGKRIVLSKDVLEEVGLFED